MCSCRNCRKARRTRDLKTFFLDNLFNIFGTVVLVVVSAVVPYMPDSKSLFPAGKPVTILFGLFGVCLGLFILVRNWMDVDRGKE